MNPNTGSTMKILFVFLCFSISCGTTGRPDYVTKQGTRIFFEDSGVETTNIEQLDDILDLVTIDWTHSRLYDKGTRLRTYRELANLEIHLVSAMTLSPCPDKPNCQVWIIGTQLGNIIHAFKNSVCWGYTSLTHEMAHWFLWRLTGDPQGTHANLNIWSKDKRGWAWNESLKLLNVFCEKVEP